MPVMGHRHQASGSASNSPRLPSSPRQPIERNSPKARRTPSTSQPTSKPDAEIMPASAAQQHFSGSTAFIIQPGPSIKRGPQPVPRDARADADTTRDFADFIRSTGPDGAPMAPTPSKATALAGNPSATSTPSGSTRGRVPRAPRKDAAALLADTSPSSSTRSNGRPRLQARDAAVRTNGTADLVSFLNSGPPGASSTGATASNRQAAQAKDSISLSSAPDSFAARSFQSVHSRTGLLENSKSAGVRSAGPSKSTNTITPQQRPAPSEESGMPARKQRRVRDPYAIESDEDEDEGGGNEESLVDFLNSVPPPEANNSPPRLTLDKATVKQAQQSHQRRSGHQLGAPRGNTLAATGSAYNASPSASSRRPPPPASSAAHVPGSIREPPRYPTGRNGRPGPPMRPRTAREDAGALRSWRSSSSIRALRRRQQSRCRRSRRRPEAPRGAQRMAGIREASRGCSRGERSRRLWLEERTEKDADTEAPVSMHYLKVPERKDWRF